MDKIKENIKQLLKTMPEKPGVYQHIDIHGQIIYVGKARNLKRRVSSYFQKEHLDIKTKQLVKNISDIRYIVVDNEQDAFLLENNLIKQYQPHYNILLKDGKSYPSICITKEDYPRIYKTRNIIKNGNEYYGPFGFGNTVDLALELIQKLYPIRTCSLLIKEKLTGESKYKVCLKYHLKQCCGVCEGKTDREKYLEYVEQARRIIRGDARIIKVELEKKMIEAAEQLKYEEAAEIKEKIGIIEKFCSKTIVSNTHIGLLDVFGYDEYEQNVYISILHIRNGSIVQGLTIGYKKQLDERKEEILAMGMKELREQINSNCAEVIVPFIPDVYDENLHINIAIGGEKLKLLKLAMQNVQQFKEERIKQMDKLNPEQRMMRILTKLKEQLGLEKIPLFIDSFDNSSIQGSQAVSACVVFKNGKPSKSEYKLFRIKTVSGIDDYASMREIVRRRYQHIIDENTLLPDLIIADGGIGQVHAIKEVIEQQLQLNIPVVGLKKDDKHKTNTLVFGDPIQEISFKVTDELFRLLVQIQDEVHRFAINYHKTRRNKAQTNSELDDIQGVGDKTKAKLLAHFHSVAQIKQAEKDELEKIVGSRLSSVIYTYFRA